MADLDKESSAVEGLLGLSELDDGRRKSNRVRKKANFLTEYETGPIDGVEEEAEDSSTREEGSEPHLRLPILAGQQPAHIDGSEVKKGGKGRPHKASSNISNQVQNFLANLGLPGKKASPLEQ